MYSVRILDPIVELIKSMSKKLSKICYLKLKSNPGG